MNFYDLIIPLGILTYIFAAATLITGLFHARLQVHKRLAFSTIILATLHAALVIYLKFF